MNIAAIRTRLLALKTLQPNVGAEQQAINKKKTEIDRKQDVLDKNTELEKYRSYTEDKSTISKNAKELANNYSKNTEKDEYKTFKKESNDGTQTLTGYQKLVANNIKKTYNTFAK